MAKRKQLPPMIQHLLTETLNRARVGNLDMVPLLLDALQDANLAPAGLLRRAYDTWLRCLKWSVSERYKPRRRSRWENMALATRDLRWALAKLFDRNWKGLSLAVLYAKNRALTMSLAGDPAAV